MMISDADDPIVRAHARWKDAQDDYDAAMVSGRGLTEESRHGLATRLAMARQSFRAAVHGHPDSIDEARAMAHALPALQPIVDDED